MNIKDLGQIFVEHFYKIKERYFRNRVSQARCQKQLKFDCCLDYLIN